MILAAILIILFAFFKAVADTLADHYYVSIFRNSNERFWNKSVSWKYAKRIANYPVDGWHLANTGMICSALSLPFIGFKPYLIHLLPLWANVLLNYGALGGLFVISFNLFYNKILRK